MSFSVSTQGIGGLSGWLGTFSSAARDRLTIAMQQHVAAVRQGALDEMAVLFRNQGGAMRNTLSTSVTTDAANRVVGTVTAAGLPYLAIQEFGGTTSPHDIFPVNGKALAFFGRGPTSINVGGRGASQIVFGAGNLVFAQVVHHPGSAIPARSYLGFALRERADQIQVSFRDVLAAVARRGWSATRDYIGL